jgi:hypothetical protein
MSRKVVSTTASYTTSHQAVAKAAGHNYRASTVQSRIKKKPNCRTANHKL